MENLVDRDQWEILAEMVYPDFVEERYKYVKKLYFLSLPDLFNSKPDCDVMLAFQTIRVAFMLTVIEVERVMYGLYCLTILTKWAEFSSSELQIFLLQHEADSKHSTVQ